MRLGWTFLCVLGIAGVAYAQDNPNYVKGQEQIKGYDAKFGETYSLKNGFNFSIVSAQYAYEPYLAWRAIVPGPTEKILVVRFAIKNASANDNFFYTDDNFTLIDKQNQVYKENGIVRLESQGFQTPSLSLRPSQGVGQAALKDPLTIGFLLPGNATIDKIMLNVGRLHTNEAALRYQLEVPPHATTEVPANLNFVTPLPECVAGPGDPWGATVQNEAKGKLDTELSTGGYGARVTECKIVPDATYRGDAAPDGKQFVVATFQIVNRLNEEGSLFGFTSGVDTQIEVVDADGEHYKVVGFSKMKTDDDPNATLQTGESYKFRVFFAVPKDTKLAKIIVCADHGRKWGVPLP